MSGNYGSPEIDCNCDDKENINGSLYRCINCGTKYELVGTNPLDAEWHEVVK